MPLGPRTLSQRPSQLSTSFRDSAFSTNSNRSYDGKTLTIDTKALDDTQVEMYRYDTDETLRQRGEAATMPLHDSSETFDGGGYRYDEDRPYEEKPSNQPSRPLRRSLPADRRYPGSRESALSNVSSIISTRHQLSPVEEKSIHESMTQPSSRSRSHELEVDSHKAMYNGVQEQRKDLRLASPGPASSRDSPQRDRDIRAFSGDGVNVMGFQHAMNMHSQPHLSTAHGDPSTSRKRGKTVSEASTTPSSALASSGLGGGWVLVNFTGSRSSPLSSLATDYRKAPRTLTRVTAQKPPDQQRQGRESGQRLDQAPQSTPDPPVKARFFKSKSRDKLRKGGG